MSISINKSFLKWAGGKSKSLDLICSKLPTDSTGRFIEPFVGSGVVFINTNFNSFIINDINTDLMSVYMLLKGNATSFIDVCKSKFINSNNSDSFYANREIFNNSTDTLERGALFIYLNRHCFNGLCRYNLSGKFNVPFGKYKTIYFPEKELLFMASKLSTCEIVCGEFKGVIEMAGSNDVVYCDPPYIPLSKTSNFSAYSKGGFNSTEQELLVELAEKSNSTFLISNSDTDITRNLYKNADEIVTIDINRSISAKSSGRGKVTELLAIYNKE